MKSLLKVFSFSFNVISFAELYNEAEAGVDFGGQIHFSDSDVTDDSDEETEGSFIRIRSFFFLWYLSPMSNTHFSTRCGGYVQGSQSVYNVGLNLQVDIRNYSGIFCLLFAFFHLLKFSHENCAQHVYAFH